MTYLNNQPIFFGAEIKQTPPHYEFTNNGYSATLRLGNRSVFWQGDEASEIIDRVESAEDWTAALADIWSDYEHVAQED